MNKLNQMDLLLRENRKRDLEAKVKKALGKRARDYQIRWQGKDLEVSAGWHSLQHSADRAAETLVSLLKKGGVKAVYRDSEQDDDRGYGAFVYVKE